MVRLLLVAGLLAFAGCLRSPHSPVGRTCSESSSCGPGLVCFQGSCVPDNDVPLDSGTEEDGGASDAGFVDAGEDAGGDAGLVDGGSDGGIGDGGYLLVAAGTSHTCGLRADGTLWCWGDNTDTQLGTAGTGSNRPRKVDASRWKRVTAGSFHTCAIREDQALWCWGQQADGRLGNGQSAQGASLPSRVGLDLWEEVCGGDRHSCGVRTDGGLSCWGAALTGQLGLSPIPSSYVTSPASVSGSWRHVACGKEHTCGIRWDGSLWCWGNNSVAQLGQGYFSAFVEAPAGVATDGGTWLAVATATDHTCALREDKSLWCWGSNAAGQVGVDAGVSVLVPTPVDGRAWSLVAVADTHSCALLEGEGSLWCWGQNNRAQRGTSDFAASGPPTRVGSERWTAVATGKGHTCAVRDDGSMWCWGRDSSGQLGVGATVRTNVPVLVDGGLWTTVAGSFGHSCGVSTDGALYCWGTNVNGQLGLPGLPFADSPLALDAGTWGFASIGRRHSCGVRGDSSLWCWGDDVSGALGSGPHSGDRSDVPVEVPADGGGWASVAAGASYMCGVKNDGTLWCWGSNTFGQLGNGASQVNRTDFPSEVVGDGGTWLGVACGEQHTCGIRSDQSLWCWGDGRSAQTGVGTVGDPSPEPMLAMDGGSWVVVSAGRAHSCAVASNGELWCWGHNGFGQLSGAPGPVSNKVDVPGVSWSSVACGGDHTCAVGADHTLWCWGKNNQGQLGTGSFAGTSFVPTQVAVDGGPGWATVAAGDYHSCGIRKDATLWCWGSDGEGQLGLGTAYQEAPARVPE